MNKNVFVFQKNQNGSTLDVATLKKFLDLYCFNNFFKQNDNVIKRDYLKNSHSVYIRRFEYLLAKNLRQKLRLLDLKKIIDCIFE